MPGEKSSVHAMFGFAASFCFGWVSFMMPAARKAKASTPTRAHRTMFMIASFGLVPAPMLTRH
jgi:hypothetical protein